MLGLSMQFWLRLFNSSSFTAIKKYTVASRARSEHAILVEAAQRNHSNFTAIKQYTVASCNKLKHAILVALLIDNRFPVIKQYMVTSRTRPKHAILIEDFQRRQLRSGKAIYGCHLR